MVVAAPQQWPRRGVLAPRLLLALLLLLLSVARVPAAAEAAEVKQRLTLKSSATDSAGAIAIGFGEGVDPAATRGIAGACSSSPVVLTEVQLSYRASDGSSAADTLSLRLTWELSKLALVAARFGPSVAGLACTGTRVASVTTDALAGLGVLAFTCQGAASSAAVPPSIPVLATLVLAPRAALSLGGGFAVQAPTAAVSLLPQGYAATGFCCYDAAAPLMLATGCGAPTPAPTAPPTPTPTPAPTPTLLPGDLPAGACAELLVGYDFDVNAPTHSASDGWTSASTGLYRHTPHPTDAALRAAAATEAQYRADKALWATYAATGRPVYRQSSSKAVGSGGTLYYDADGSWTVAFYSGLGAYAYSNAPVPELVGNRARMKLPGGSFGGGGGGGGGGGDARAWAAAAGGAAGGAAAPPAAGDDSGWYVSQGGWVRSASFGVVCRPCGVVLSLATPAAAAARAAAAGGDAGAVSLATGLAAAAAAGLAAAGAGGFGALSTFGLRLNASAWALGTGGGTQGKGGEEQEEEHHLFRPTKRLTVDAYGVRRPVYKLQGGGGVRLYFSARRDRWAVGFGVEPSATPAPTPLPAHGFGAGAELTYFHTPVLLGPSGMHAATAAQATGGATAGWLALLPLLGRHEGLPTAALRLRCRPSAAAEPPLAPAALLADARRHAADAPRLASTSSVPPSWRPSAAQQAALFRSEPRYGDASWFLELMRVPTAWRVHGVSGAGVTIGVNDDGVDFDHVDFRGKVRARPSSSSGSSNGSSGGSSGSGTAGSTAGAAGVQDEMVYDKRARAASYGTEPIPSSGAGHGTSCAGLAAARADNGACGAGAAPNAAVGAALLLSSDPAVTRPSLALLAYQYANVDPATGQDLPWPAADGAGGGVGAVADISSNSWNVDACQLLKLKPSRRRLREDEHARRLQQQQQQQQQQGEEEEEEEEEDKQRRGGHGDKEKREAAGEGGWRKPRQAPFEDPERAARAATWRRLAAAEASKAVAAAAAAGGGAGAGANCPFLGTIHGTPCKAAACQPTAVGSGGATAGGGSAAASTTSVWSLGLPMGSSYRLTLPGTQAAPLGAPFPAGCVEAIHAYCGSSLRAEVDAACSEYRELFAKCAYNQLSSSSATALALATAKGRRGLGTIFVFASGNEFNIGDDVNGEGYLNSIRTITVGAVGVDGRLASYRYLLVLSPPSSTYS